MPPPPGKDSECELSSESNGVPEKESVMATSKETISVATPRLLRVEVVMRAQCRLTIVLRQGESRVYNLKQERYLALACSTLVSIYDHGALTASIAPIKRTSSD